MVGRSLRSGLLAPDSLTPGNPHGVHKSFLFDAGDQGLLPFASEGGLCIKKFLAQLEARGTFVRTRVSCAQGAGIRAEELASFAVVVPTKARFPALRLVSWLARCLKVFVFRRPCCPWGRVVLLLV